MQRRLLCFSLFWHALDIVWVGLFTVVYLMGVAHDRQRDTIAHPETGRCLPRCKQGTPSGVLVYTIGLLLAVILTATSFWVANTSLLWAPGVPLGLAVLAIAQMGVHLVFFLHITTGPDNTNNVLALAFGVLIVTPGGRRLAVDHGQSERQHDAAARADEYAYAALNALEILLYTIKLSVFRGRSG